MFKSKRITTPLGIASYPSLNPDNPDTRFQEMGEYKVKLIVPKEEAADFIKEVEAFHAEAKEHFRLEKKSKKPVKVCPLPIAEEVDDDGNLTGNVLLNCKLKAKGLRKDGTTYSNKLVLFGADLEPFVPEGQISGGSTMKVALNLFPWHTSLLGCGVTFKIDAVQIINVVEYAGRPATATGYGFGAEEGNATTKETAEEVSTPPSTGAEAGEFDF